MLLAWNAAINLTAIRDPAEVAVRHVADSLLGLAVLREAGVEAFIDLGSGGGFPGIPLAIALPGVDALLVESVGKKARFLETAVAAIGAAGRVAVAAVRGETLGHDPVHRGQWPAVVARAVAPLDDLVELAFPLLRRGGRLIAWKSGDPDDQAGLGGEIRAAMARLGDGTIEVHPSVRHALGATRSPALDAIAEAIGDHRIVTVQRGSEAVPDAWPKDPGVRRRRRS